MSSSSKNQQTLAPIATHWHNRSLSSVTSDAATFHSAHAHTSVELKHMSSGQDTPSARTDTSTPRPQSPPQHTMPSPKLEALKMARQDSGYAAGQDSSSSSRRTSTSSSTRRLKAPSKRNSNTTSTRPSTKRASRSSPTTAQAVRTSTSSRRPSLHTRHTTSPAYQQTMYQPYQFFQFPMLQEPEDAATPPTPPAPPATCQYWTSDSTRRLEYAAIDAASRGVRGFFLKLVPDCILPPSSRRPRFHCDDEASDAGSVRRYRLALPEEKELSSERQGERSTRPSGLRRWTSAWRRGIP